MCLPLQKRQPDGEQSTASAPRVLGALTVGFAEGADVSAAVLQRAVLVAHAVARHQQPALQEFAGMLASMLLPQQPAAVEDSSDDDGSSSEWERELSDRETDMPSASGSGSSAIGEGAALHAVLHPRVSMHPFTLRFSERRYEHSFAAFHAAHLQRIDGLAYLICAAFIWCDFWALDTRLAASWRVLLGPVVAQNPRWGRLPASTWRCSASRVARLKRRVPRHRLMPAPLLLPCFVQPGGAAARHAHPRASTAAGVVGRAWSVCGPAARSAAGFQADTELVRLGQGRSSVGMARCRGATIFRQLASCLATSVCCPQSPTAIHNPTHPRTPHSLRAHPQVH